MLDRADRAGVLAGVAADADLGVDQVLFDRLGHRFTGGAPFQGCQISGSSNRAQSARRTMPCILRSRRKVTASPRCPGSARWCGGSGQSCGWFASLMSSGSRPGRGPGPHDGEVPGQARDSCGHAMCSFTYSKSPGLLSMPDLGRCDPGCIFAGFIARFHQRLDEIAIGLGRQPFILTLLSIPRLR